MVSMDVSFYCHHKAKAELLDNREVAFRRLQHWIHKEALSCFLAPNKVGVSGGLRFEKLAEEHGSRYPNLATPYRFSGAEAQSPWRPSARSLRIGQSGRWSSVQFSARCFSVSIIVSISMIFAAR